MGSLCWQKMTTILCDDSPLCSADCVDCKVWRTLCWCLLDALCSHNLQLMALYWVATPQGHHHTSEHAHTHLGTDLRPTKTTAGSPSPPPGTANAQNTLVCNRCGHGEHSPNQCMRYCNPQLDNQDAWVGIETLGWQSPNRRPHHVCAGTAVHKQPEKIHYVCLQWSTTYYNAPCSGRHHPCHLHKTNMPSWRPT